MTMVISMLVRLLEAMFVVGLAGSAIVFVLTTIEDAITMASKDEPVPVDPPRSEA